MYTEGWIMWFFCAPPMACLTENLWDILFLPWLSPYNGWLMGGSPREKQQGWNDNPAGILSAEKFYCSCAHRRPDGRGPALIDILPSFAGGEGAWGWEHEFYFLEASNGETSSCSFRSSTAVTHCQLQQMPLTHPLPLTSLTFHQVSKYSSVAMPSLWECVLYCIRVHTESKLSGTLQVWGNFLTTSIYSWLLDYCTYHVSKPSHTVTRRNAEFHSTARMYLD